MKQEQNNGRPLVSPWYQLFIEITFIKLFQVVHSENSFLLLQGLQLCLWLCYMQSLMFFFSASLGYSSGIAIGKKRFLRFHNFTIDSLNDVTIKFDFQDSFQIPLNNLGRYAIINIINIIFSFFLTKSGIPNRWAGNSGSRIIHYNLVKHCKKIYESPGNVPHLFCRLLNSKLTSMVCTAAYRRALGLSIVFHNPGKSWDYLIQFFPEKNTTK